MHWNGVDHRSQGLYVVVDELGSAAYFTINWWCFMTRLSQSAAIICNKCQHIKHSIVPPMMSCSSERFTWTGHICCSLCTTGQWKSQDHYVSSHEAATDELRSASYCIIIQWTQLPPQQTCICWDALVLLDRMNPLWLQVTSFQLQCEEADHNTR